MVSLMGPPPPEYLAQSDKAAQYWDDQGTFLPCPIAFYSDIFIIGNWKGSIPIPTQSLETREQQFLGEDKELFLNFLRRILRWLPEERPTAEELAHQLTLSESRLLVTHAASLPAAQVAAQTAGIPPERIIVLGAKPSGSAYATVEELIASGLSRLPTFVERRLAPGEAKKKLAFLCFSSGTTGKPKAVSVSHYSMISNNIQMRQCIGKAPRYEAGDVVLGGESIHRPQLRELR